MVYHHRTVKCPHCGKVADHTRTVDSELLKGSPFRVCRHCSTTYFDSEYKEMGLVLFEEKGGKLTFVGLVWILLSHSLVIYSLYNIIVEKLSDMLLPLVVFGIIALWYDIGLTKMIKNRAHSAEFHQRQVDYIEGRTKERTAALIESMERLSNKDYLDALRSHGVDVPDYFYERLQSNTERIEGTPPM